MPFRNYLFRNYENSVKATMNSFFLLAIVCGVVETFFQLFWVRKYFLYGIYLRRKVVDIASIPRKAPNKEQRLFLRRFDLKRINSEEFIVRQGKFGISQSIFFHGFVKIDKNGGQVIVKTFVHLSLVFFSMACGRQIFDNQWLGAGVGAAIAWTVARYFVEKGLLLSMAEEAYSEV